MTPMESRDHELTFIWGLGFMRRIKSLLVVKFKTRQER